MASYASQLVTNRSRCPATFSEQTTLESMSLNKSSAYSEKQSIWVPFVKIFASLTKRHTFKFDKVLKHSRQINFSILI